MSQTKKLNRKGGRRLNRVVRSRKSNPRKCPYEDFDKCQIWFKQKGFPSYKNRRRATATRRLLKNRQKH